MSINIISKCGMDTYEEKVNLDEWLFFINNLPTTTSRNYRGEAIQGYRQVKGVCEIPISLFVSFMKKDPSKYYSVIN